MNEYSELEKIIVELEGIKVSDMLSKFEISSTAKSILNILSKKIFIDINNFGEKYTLKSICLDKYGKLKESISLPSFKYTELAEEEWLNSKLRNYFLNAKFLFVIYQKEGKDVYLRRAKLWHMPVNIIENDVRMIWTEVHYNIINGRIVKYVNPNGTYKTFFPASTDSPYIHVRPHAQNKDDTYPLSVPDKVTGLNKYVKHSFWINRSYILKIINEVVND